MIAATASTIASWCNAKLVGHDCDIRGVGIDSRSIGQGSLFVALPGERVDGHRFVGSAFANGAGAALVDESRLEELLNELKSSDVALLASNDVLSALANLAHAWRQQTFVSMVAVTGSNGKTTVKEMLSAVFRRVGTTHATSGNFNNHIGVPLTLLAMEPTDRYAVVEMGANHPGEIAALTEIAQPQVGVITQCAPAHLAGFKTVDGVARAKAEIYEGLPAAGTAVINADDAYASLWRKIAGHCKQLTFGLSNAADVYASDLKASAEGTRFDLCFEQSQTPVQLNLAGEHNVRNALAVAAAAIACHVELDAIAAGLSDVQPVGGRMQPRRGLGGATIIDDTYNANPVSLQAGLAVLATRGGERWLVLGDMAELGDEEREFHREAGRLARAHGVTRLYGCGQLTSETVSSFGQDGRHFRCRGALSESVRADLDAQSDAEGVTILVKGSRSAGMEAVVRAITVSNGGSR
ncbi:MAG: UDP-N-acetylmuramoyl-tripeptide--D-alanyl-D-alanine ligase [Pseudomonadota bacterium]